MDLELLSKQYDEIYKIIGKFILTFGSLEYTLHECLITLIKHFFPNDDKNYYRTLNMILKVNNSFSINLDILRFIVSNLIEERYRSEWEDFIKDAAYIMERRNLYAHNMYGVEEDGSLAKDTVSKSYKKEQLFITIEFDVLNKEYNLLYERYRQLIDSVEHYPRFKANNRQPFWISKFNRLEF